MISENELRAFRRIVSRYSKLRYGRSGLLDILDSITNILKVANMLASGKQAPPGPGVSQSDVEAARKILSDIQNNMPASDVLVDPEVLSPVSGVQPAGTPPAVVPTSPSYRTRAPEAPPREGEAHPFDSEILTPQSSNVFSFSYDMNSSTLYVTYKAPALNRKKISTEVNRAGVRQLAGTKGSISGRTNARGAMYAYYDVPLRIYAGMKRAASKGGYVWDQLRIRHSVYAHRYKYGLVQGAIVLQKGLSGTYIPRRATKLGLRVRAVPIVGQGRRAYQTSTLPESLRVRR